MSKYKPEVEREVDRTIELLFEQTGEELTPDPFLYERVSAALNEDNNNFVRRFRIDYLIPITLAVMFLLNVLTLVNGKDFRTSDTGERSQQIESFKEEYWLKDY